HLVFRVSAPGIPRDEAARSMNLLTREVLPAFARAPGDGHASFSRACGGRAVCRSPLGRARSRVGVGCAARAGQRRDIAPQLRARGIRSADGTTRRLLDAAESARERA